MPSLRPHTPSLRCARSRKKRFRAESRKPSGQARRLSCEADPVTLAGDRLSAKRGGGRGQDRLWDSRGRDPSRAVCKLRLPMCRREVSPGRRVRHRSSRNRHVGPSPTRCSGRRAEHDSTRFNPASDRRFRQRRIGPAANWRQGFSTAPSRWCSKRPAEVALLREGDCPGHLQPRTSRLGLPPHWIARRPPGLQVQRVLVNRAPVRRRSRQLHSGPENRIIIGLPSPQRRTERHEGKGCIPGRYV